MKNTSASQLDAYLERFEDRARQLRQLNLAADGELQQALEESQHLLASIAMYRHLLKHMAQAEVHQDSLVEA